MTTGLVIGKFMPLHQGHIGLVNFAAKRCDELIVLLGALRGEPIPGPVRLKWLKETFADRPHVRIEYTEEDLPTAQESSREVSQVWAKFLKRRFPEVTDLFSSEPYGDFLAEFMGIRHCPYDPDRTRDPISATAIREGPLKNWDLLAPAARPYYLKKICLFGPESTGKSVLAQRLAKHFGSTFVPEMARDFIGDREIVPNMFPEILQLQAKAVIEATKTATRVLFCDTDHLTTTLYYSEFFSGELEIPSWVEETHRYDLYLFCDIDAPWVDDSQRFFRDRRLDHRMRFLEVLTNRKLPVEVVSGGWEDRFKRSVSVIEDRWEEISLTSKGCS